ncbi:DUF3048 domain-containing protein [Paenibacillus sp. ACRRX]|uniref:DUF3048 domain-containing protein n=1 Tax=Paenibacillus sp. ACRRX TaxID=2918206 RepID=UPI001EF3E0C3|nr:DUF3048 domain-containing protein [Paenibacillus sp. ACRRX]MCG7409542.1 DUF3048 domain-containing protein [Paenibacillus sp. ACRRX]
MRESSFFRGQCCLLVLLLSLSLITACTQATTVNYQEKSDKPTQEEMIIPEQETSDPLQVLAPFTGLAAQEQAIQQRPIAVMVNNYKAARPQSGLSYADVLIEVLAEGGISRLVAIYQSQNQYAGSIGPVRSIRPYLIELGESYKAVLVHAGGSPDGYRILQQQHKPYLDEISNAGSYFWRDKSRRAPHNLYTSLARLEQGIAKKKYKQTEAIPVMSFSVEGKTEHAALAYTTEAAGKIMIALLKNSELVEYQYDANRGNYIRYVAGKQHVDKENQEALRAVNVLAVEAKHQVLDKAGRLSVDVVTGGKAIWFRNGRAAFGNWVRQAGGPIQFQVDGKVIPLQPGITHIMIVPSLEAKESHVKWSE